MTIAFDLGRKATKQTNKQNNKKCLRGKKPLCYGYDSRHYKRDPLCDTFRDYRGYFVVYEMND